MTLGRGGARLSLSGGAGEATYNDSEIRQEINVVEAQVNQLRDQFEEGIGEFPLEHKTGVRHFASLTAAAGQSGTGTFNFNTAVNEADSSAFGNDSEFWTGFRDLVNDSLSPANYASIEARIVRYADGVRQEREIHANLLTGDTVTYSDDANRTLSFNIGSSEGEIVWTDDYGNTEEYSEWSITDGYFSLLKFFEPNGAIHDYTEQLQRVGNPRFIYSDDDDVPPQNVRIVIFDKDNNTLHFTDFEGIVDSEVVHNIIREGAIYDRIEIVDADVQDLRQQFDDGIGQFRAEHKVDRRNATSFLGAQGGTGTGTIVFNPQVNTGSLQMRDSDAIGGLANVINAGIGTHGYASIQMRIVRYAEGGVRQEREVHADLIDSDYVEYTPGGNFNVHLRSDNGRIEWTDDYGDPETLNNWNIGNCYFTQFIFYEVDGTIHDYTNTFKDIGNARYTYVEDDHSAPDTAVFVMFDPTDNSIHFDTFSGVYDSDAQQVVFDDVVSKLEMFTDSDNLGFRSIDAEATRTEYTITWVDGTNAMEWSDASADVTETFQPNKLTGTLTTDEVITPFTTSTNAQYEQQWDDTWTISSNGTQSVRLVAKQAGPIDNVISATPTGSVTVTRVTVGRAATYTEHSTVPISVIADAVESAASNPSLADLLIGGTYVSTQTDDDGFTAIQQSFSGSNYFIVYVSGATEVRTSLNGTAYFTQTY